MAAFLARQAREEIVEQRWVGRQKFTNPIADLSYWLFRGAKNGSRGPTVTVLVMVLGSGVSVAVGVTVTVLGTGVLLAVGVTVTVLVTGVSVAVGVTVTVLVTGVWVLGAAVAVSAADGAGVSVRVCVLWVMTVVGALPTR
jgi:hypothetical protein